MDLWLLDLSLSNLPGSMLWIGFWTWFCRLWMSVECTVCFCLPVQRPRGGCHYIPQSQTPSCDSCNIPNCNPPHPPPTVSCNPVSGSATVAELSPIRTFSCLLTSSTSLHPGQGQPTGQEASVSKPPTFISTLPTPLLVL